MVTTQSDGLDPRLRCIEKAWDEKAWSSQDTGVAKINRDWETDLKHLHASPLPSLVSPPGAASVSVIPTSNSIMAPQLSVVCGSAQSETIAESSLSISRQSVDLALSLTPSRQFRRPFPCPTSATGDNIPLSLNTFKIFKAAAFLQGPLQSPAQGQFSLPKPAPPETQEEILIEMTGEESLSCSVESVKSKAPGITVMTGRHEEQDSCAHTKECGLAKRLSESE